jgi:hypothetical protein
VTARLTGRTLLAHPETGDRILLEGGQDLPDWAEGLVGPHLLEEAEPPTEPDKPSKPARGRTAAK